MLTSPTPDLAQLNQLILSLVTAPVSSKQLGVNEINLQYTGKDSEETTLLRLLSPDNGGAQKLKIPFLASVATAPISFTPLSYKAFLRSVPPTDIASLPVIPSRPSDVRELKGLLDYWLADADCKQITIKSKELLVGLVLQRSPESEVNTEATFRMEVGSALNMLSNKKRKTFRGRYMLTDVGSDDRNTNEWFSCDVSKLMVTFDRCCDIWIDGVPFSDITFMNVSSRYYSKTRNFPLCVPFAQSFECSSVCNKLSY